MRATGGESSPVNERTNARRKRIFANRDIDAKRVTGQAPKRVTATNRSYAIFTRILVGYSAAQRIYVPKVAEALEAKLFSLARARAFAPEKAASRQAQLELQECSAQRDLIESLGQRKLRR